MKKLVIITMLLSQIILSSCSSSDQDTKVSHTSVTMLVDCTSESQYNDIYNDIHTNLPKFLQTTGIATIDYNQRFTMKFGFIESTGNLLLTTESIALPQKSKIPNNKAAEIRKATNIMQMIDDQLTAGKSIADTKQKRSPIVDVLLKSMIELTAESTSYIMIFSDGVEYSDAANFYKSIPYSDEAFEKYYEKIDPYLLQESVIKIRKIQPKVRFYLISSEEGVKKADLKRFYIKLFDKIGIKEYKFCDNLSQNVQSFKAK